MFCRSYKQRSLQFHFSLLLLVVALKINPLIAGTKEKHFPYEARTSSPLPPYRTAGFSWDEGRIQTGLCPDGLLEEKRGSTRQQLLGGSYAFIDEVMSFEFVGWITPGSFDLVLADVEHDIRELFSHDVWMDSGLPRQDVGKFSLVSLLLIRREGDKAWDEAVPKGKKVILGSKHSLFFRVRLELPRDDLDRLLRNGKEAKLAILVRINPGAVPGNEEFAKALASRKGRPKELCTARVGFRIVSKEQGEQSESLQAAYARWRIRKAGKPGDERWKWYEKLLEIQPVNETAMFSYAIEAARAGDSQRAATVLTRLIETVKKRPKSTHPIPSVDPSYLQWPLTLEAEQWAEMANEHRPSRLAGMIKALEGHRSRLRKESRKDPQQQK